MKHLSLHGLWQYFDETVCGGEVNNGKPEPDIYKLAAEKLGLEPRECLAFEDSPNGVISAHRAGCVTIMVPDLDEPTKELMKMVDYKIDSLMMCKKCDLKGEVIMSFKKEAYANLAETIIDKFAKRGFEGYYAESSDEAVEIASRFFTPGCT
ncbi:MAG: HAD family hydrolase, partial [Lachnospiraceae bacterium]|nr:HAD family hydrolase [Lachnospiraceae bacterium]